MKPTNAQKWKTDGELLRAASHFHLISQTPMPRPSTTNLSNTKKLRVLNRQRNPIFPRFGLRFLLLALTAIALWVGWMANLNRQAKLEREAIKNLGPHEPLVLYSYHFEPSGKRIPGAKPPAKSWVNRIFDEYPFVSVRVLAIEQCEELEDLREVKKLKHLKQLSLRYVRQINSLDEIKHLANLESVSLEAWEDLDDISALSDLKKLKAVRLVACPRLRDLSPLTSVTALNDIDLFSNELVTNIDFLSKASHLEFVAISGKLNSIDGLRNSPKLTKLYLDLKDTANQPPEMFDCLASCKRLENVSVHHGNFRNLEWLRASTDLKSLHVQSVNLKDVQAIEGKQNLENVTIWGADLLTNLSGVQNLKSLRELDISGTGVKNFESLGRLPTLEVLIAKSSEKLTSLKGLIDFPSLRRLELDRCSALTDLQYIGSAINLQVLGCYDCDMLSDISHLRELQLLKRVNFFMSENVSGGEFFLDLNIAPEFLNFVGTKVTLDLQERLREKFQKSKISGRRGPRW